MAYEASPDALDLKQQAIALVEGMRYPDLDTTPAGKDFRKQEILIALRAGIDGLYRDQAFLDTDEPFRQDVRAARRVTQLRTDPKVDPSVVEAAGTALDLVARADRLLVTDLVDAAQIFPQPFPKRVADDLRRADAELAKGDTKLERGHAADAVLDFVKAYRYADAAGTTLFATFDVDGDGLPVAQETKLGTDAAKADSDRDGLSDGDEVDRTGTDPADVDTRDTGVADGAKDPDADGLPHTRELALGTDPLEADTDGDRLDDGVEVARGTDPRKQDPDADGLTDDSELRLSTDPRYPDSDDDGLLDGLETYTTTAAGPQGAVSVSLTGPGDAARSASFRSLADDQRFRNVPGQLSPAYDIDVTSAFTGARVAFTYDPATVPGGDIAGLRVMYYDELAQTFLELSTQGVDPSKRVAWAETTHFSTYVLFYIPTWNAVWTQQQGGGRGGDDGEVKNLDVVLTLDSSGSMQWNDPADQRKEAARQFISALIPGDRAAVVDFDDRGRLVTGLTTDRAVATAAVGSIDSNGGTDIGAGVRLGNSELIGGGDPDHLKAQIVLTDGVGNYDERLTAEAKAAGIVIYTVSLGYDVDAGLLQRIAAGTGGTYYAVSNADGLPQVFRRIADGGAELTDGDGDGLPDRQETEGIRLCTGEMLRTDPSKRDTDGDGVSDLEELGQRQSVPAGTCYAPATDPTATDTDGDGLLDGDENDIGTSRTDPDTDGDGLSDGVEVDDFGSDPFDGNLDGDRRDDAEERERDSDPYYRDLEGWDHAKAAGAGFLWGDSGERAVRWHLMDRETLESMSYLAGWLASGYAVVGDVRDFGSALWDGRFGGALLSAAALVPLAGDAVKTAGVVRKFVSFSDSLRLPVTKWIVRQFPDHPTVRKVLYAVVGAPSGLDSLDDITIDALAAARNDLQLLSRILPDGRTLLRSASLSATGRAAVQRRIDTLWGTTLSATLRAEAVAVESAVEVLLARGHTVLYVGRPGAVPGTATHVSQGPDIIARTAAGRPVVVEAKGAVHRLSLNNSRLSSTVGGQRLRQPTRDWIDNNAETRYLDVLHSSTDANVQQAADLIGDIRNNAGYDAIVVAASPSTRVGKIDDTLDELHQDPSVVAEVLRLDIALP